MVIYQIGLLTTGSRPAEVGGALQAPPGAASAQLDQNFRAAHIKLSDLPNPNFRDLLEQTFEVLITDFWDVTQDFLDLGKS